MICPSLLLLRPTRVQQLLNSNPSPAVFPPFHTLTSAPLLLPLTQARERKHALHDASAREHELTNAFVGVQQQVEAQRMATRRAEDLTAKERRRADEATLKANDWRRHLKRAQAEVRRTEELLAQSEKERLELRSKYVE